MYLMMFAIFCTLALAFILWVAAEWHYHKELHAKLFRLEYRNSTLEWDTLVGPLPEHDIDTCIEQLQTFHPTIPFRKVEA